MNIKPGDYVMCFDSLEWSRVGHDVGDNSKFYYEAEVLRIYKRSDLMMCDIRWAHSGKESKGHFVSGLREKIYENK